MGHTKQTTLTLILSKYLWMSWTCLPEEFVSFSIYRLLSSLSTFNLNGFFFRKFSPPFPSRKKGNTIHDCFFCYWRGRHIGNWPNDHPVLRGQGLWLMIPTIKFSLSRIPLNKFGVSRLFEINCRSNRRENGTQIGHNRKHRKPHGIPKPKNR